MKTKMKKNVSTPTDKENSLSIRHGILSYRRTPIEMESPEEQGHHNMKYNLAESSVPDLNLVTLDLDLKTLVLSYTDHRGDYSLRKRIAGKEFHTDDILITAGASAALFITATSLLRPGDHAVILHPNYVTNIETPRAINCKPDYLRLSFENQFQIDLDTLEQLINSKPRLISITYPHNPTGAVISEPELRRIISLVESEECYLLVDETYREMTFGAPLPVAAALSSRVISVSSMSKSYGLPGIRVGWLITRDEQLMERFLAAKEQIHICNSVIDEKIADQFLVKKEEFFLEIKEHIKTNFETVKSWMDNNEFLEWVEPAGGCVCFPRIKSDLQVNVEEFYRVLNQKYKTFVGPGHWFEMDDRYMRIGYGYPSNDELLGGLNCIVEAIKETIT